MTRLALLCISLAAAATAQDSVRPGAYTHDARPYVHDTTGDHGPYYYWKLRQQAKAAKQQSRVANRRQRPSQQRQQQPAFANFQPSAPAPSARPLNFGQAFVAAPAQQPAWRQPAAPEQPRSLAAPSPVTGLGLRFQFKIAAPEFNYENNFAKNSYAFSSPLYSTQAAGGSYSYQAQY